MAANLALAGSINAAVLTGYVHVAEAGQQNGSFTSSSLTLNSTNLILTYSGGFTGQVPAESELTADNSTISGLSSSASTESINDFLVFSVPYSVSGSGTTPLDRFDFDLTSLTEVSYNAPNNATFSGTGMLIDTTGAYANTPATLSLSFSGPSTYSFTLTAAPVPEPTTIGLFAAGLLGAFAFRRRKS